MLHQQNNCKKSVIKSIRGFTNKGKLEEKVGDILYMYNETLFSIYEIIKYLCTAEEESI